MAMTFGRDVNVQTSFGEFDKPEETDAFGEPEKNMPVHSGLSALIQAATTQLGQLDDADLQPGDASSVHFDENIKTPHGGSSSLLGAAGTPTLGPESTEVRQQTFPEVLMTLLEDKNNEDVITFLPDGKYFAIQRKDFCETTLMNYFSSVGTFEEFLEKIHGWGFSRIDPRNKSGIEIFRHPMFVRGDWEKCSHISYGENPTDVRVSALPERTRIEHTLSDESTLCSSKRRLSPGHARQESESSTTTSKQKIESVDAPLSTVAKTESNDTQDSDDTKKTEEDYRCLALAITTEKMNLKGDAEEEEKNSTPLIERAVENATHTIVTDAIETLLRDEGHTRETYLKHERELSRSSLPGVVPISKQLFSPSCADPEGGEVELERQHDEGTKEDEAKPLVESSNTGVTTPT